MPVVSVIVPVYKIEKYIAATVQSVLNQVFTDFELLLIDDGSPDRSVEIIQQFTDPRIRLIRQQNRGLAGARNTGIRHARGQYLAFLDGDDLWAPEKLAKHVYHLNLNLQVGISYSFSTFIDEAGNPLGIYQTARINDITPGYILCRNPVGNGSNPVIRREVFDEIRFQANLHGTVEDFYFDESFRRAEDTECWLRMAIQTNWKFEGVPEPLTLYRVNSSGLSADVTKQLEALEAVINKTLTYAPEVMQQWATPARAYHLRYLCRRAVTLRDGDTAWKLYHETLTTYWKILLEEPRRTLLTGLATYLLCFLPRSLYRLIENTGMRVTGANQYRQISSASKLETSKN